MDALKRLGYAYLYLITPAMPKAGPLDGFLPRVLEAGVDVVQLREKEMAAGRLLRYSEVVRRRTEEFEALFMINDRADVAAVAGADGVHVGQDDLEVSAARGILGKGKIVGLSTHTQDEVLDSSEKGPDYIGLGPIHPTPTKEGRPAVGYDLVRFAAERSRVPFYAIGGIDPSNLDDVLAAGARRVSVLRAITEAPDPAEIVRRMKQVLLEVNSPS